VWVCLVWITLVCVWPLLLAVQCPCCSVRPSSLSVKIFWSNIENVHQPVRPCVHQGKLAARAQPGRFLGYERPFGYGVVKVLLDGGGITQSQAVLDECLCARTPPAQLPGPPRWPAQLELIHHHPIMQQADEAYDRDSDDEVCLRETHLAEQSSAPTDVDNATGDDAQVADPQPGTGACQMGKTGPIRESNLMGECALGGQRRQVQHASSLKRVLTTRTPTTGTQQVHTCRVLHALGQL
jgi:hypothetical protein